MSDGPKFSKIFRRRHRMILKHIEVQVCQEKLSMICFQKDSKAENDLLHKEAQQTSNQISSCNDLFSARSMQCKATTVYLTTREISLHCGNQRKACSVNSKETRYIMNSTAIIISLALEVKMRSRSKEFSRRSRIKTTVGRQL